MYEYLTRNHSKIAKIIPGGQSTIFTIIIITYSNLYKLNVMDNRGSSV